LLFFQLDQQLLHYKVLGEDKPILMLYGAPSITALS
jgi:hypothetical protein